MFRELGKLKDAERLLKERKFCEVLALVRDPEIREHKRAHDARAAARTGLLEEARADLDAGRLPAAGRKVRLTLDDGDDPRAAELDSAIRSAAIRAESDAKAAQRAIREARWHEAHGDRDKARRLLEPFASPDVASFIRQLDDSDKTERAAADGIAGAIGSGTSPEGLRERLREVRQSVKDPRILADVHSRALDAAAQARDPGPIAALVRDTRAAGIDAGEALERATEALVAAARAKLAEGEDPAAVAEFLMVFPAGSRADAEGGRLKLACWAQGRARAMAARGHEKLAAELAAEAAASLPESGGGRAGEISRTARKVAHLLAEARDLASRGEHDEARRLLDDAVAAEPAAVILGEWSDALDAAIAETDAIRAEARAALDSGDLRKARRAVLRLLLRAGRPADLAPLLGELESRDEEAQRTAIAAERQMMRKGGVSPPSPAAPRREPMPDFSKTPALVLPGDPFVLRIENEGDWLVQPGAKLSIGNQANGEADLQVLAAIGAKHAVIERSFEQDGAASYRLVAAPGQKVLRNGKPVTECRLENGDRIQLGSALQFTVHRPSAGNATAVLRLHGDFAVLGCTRVVLFAETGRKGSILLAPGSDGHIPLRSVDARLEVFRADQDEEAGELFARSPQGVAAGDAPERAQVHVRASQVLAVGALRVHVDAAQNRPRE
jgi:hypothetical protein